MVEAPILVIGGGPAGVSAAIALAELGQRVVLVEQRDKLGGAIHRQPAQPDGSGPSHLPRHARRWKELMTRLGEVDALIERWTSTVFLGIDGTGRILLDDRRAGRVVAVHARGAIVALGAIERVHPFPGWELPGVITAGGAQLLLKETGEPPQGPILVAGNGPLPFALGAQLTAAGNPPVAVLERGQPWRRVRALAHVLTSPAQGWEAITYAARLAAHRVPYLMGAEVSAVEAQGRGLTVHVRHGSVARVYHVSHLVVHDGLHPNRTGVPPEDFETIPVRAAGDGLEILGADAAILDGRRAAADMAARLNLPHRTAPRLRALDRARRFQSALIEIYRATPPIPPDETVICRCEALRMADLRAMPRGFSSRELRLVGRFGMGPCQGRFCGATLATLKAETPIAASPAPVRWPLRPVSVAALAQLHDHSFDGALER